jgi:hypothetical protein
VGGQAALRARDGRLVAVLDVSDKWRPDKELEAREVYRTTDAKHPGVAYLMSTPPVYVGGEIHVIDRPRRRSSRPITATRPRRGRSSPSGAGRASWASRPETRSTGPRVHHEDGPRDLRRAPDSPRWSARRRATISPPTCGCAATRCSSSTTTRSRASCSRSTLPRCATPARARRFSTLSPEELRLLALHRGARSRRGRQFLRDVRCAGDLPRLCSIGAGD